jgi:homoserine kinase
LRTSKSRKQLPEEIPFKDAAFNVGRAALLGASIASGKFENMVMATKDKLHQPYRNKLIPNMYDIIDMCTKAGAKGAFLSGAGPSIIALVDENYNLFEETANNFISQLENNWKVSLIECDNNGIQVTKKL